PAWPSDGSADLRWRPSRPWVSKHSDRSAATPGRKPDRAPLTAGSRCPWARGRRTLALRGRPKPGWPAAEADICGCQKRTVRPRPHRAAVSRRGSACPGRPPAQAARPPFPPAPADGTAQPFRRTLDAPLSHLETCVRPPGLLDPDGLERSIWPVDSSSSLWRYNLVEAPNRISCSLS